MAGDYLVGLGTLGAGGQWPSAEGRLYGATVALEAGSLVWYPKAAMERAGYQVPGSWDELAALEQAMIADGRTPMVPRDRGLQRRWRRVHRGDRAPRGRP